MTWGQWDDESNTPAIYGYGSLRPEDLGRAVLRAIHDHCRSAHARLSEAQPDPSADDDLTEWSDWYEQCVEVLNSHVNEYSPAWEYRGCEFDPTRIGLFRLYPDDINLSVTNRGGPYGAADVARLLPDGWRVRCLNNGSLLVSGCEEHVSLGEVNSALATAGIVCHPLA